MINPDFFFDRATDAKVLFFEYSTENSNFQSDLHEIYRPVNTTAKFPSPVYDVILKHGVDVVSVTYDHPNKNPELTPGFYFSADRITSLPEALFDFARACEYDVTEEDIPEPLDHGKAQLIGVGVFPGRGELGFHMVYRGDAEDFESVAEIDPRYKNFAFQYVLTKAGTSRHAVEFFDGFEILSFEELNSHITHCEEKVQETYGERVRISEVCSYKFFLNTDEKKMYYRVILHD